MDENKVKSITLKDSHLILLNPGFVVESESSWIIWNCVRDDKDHLKTA